MAIIELKDAKEFLKVDYDDEDSIIEDLIIAAEIYLKSATGKDFTNENKLAVLYCKVLINEWYNNRELIYKKSESDKVRFTLQSILLQLKYSGVN
ncbi:head-tail connector protein [uncultured Clostridium sp.]|uniref:head-tail connector protein n=1 Tax=uncultured Clostridium sp. TaxID=59620 RepID=UPI0026038371|nr:head-tail connector protein [uncultured Clostridium sp.]